MCVTVETQSDPILRYERDVCECISYDECRRTRRVAHKSSASQIWHESLYFIPRDTWGADFCFLTEFHPTQLAAVHFYFDRVQRFTRLLNNVRFLRLTKTLKRKMKRQRKHIFKQWCFETGNYQTVVISLAFYYNNWHLSYGNDYSSLIAKDHC